MTCRSTEGPCSCQNNPSTWAARASRILWTGSLLGTAAALAVSAALG